MRHPKNQRCRPIDAKYSDSVQSSEVVLYIDDCRDRFISFVEHILHQLRWVWCFVFIYTSQLVQEFVHQAQVVHLFLSSVDESAIFCYLSLTSHAWHQSQVHHRCIYLKAVTSWNAHESKNSSHLTGETRKWFQFPVLKTKTFSLEW